MVNPFCRHLSHGMRLYIQNDTVTWTPCCQWTGSRLDFNNFNDDRRRINIHQPWVNRECHRCGREEIYKQDQSYRHAGEKIIPHDLTAGQLGWLDIQADSTCNGRCLICGPWNSTAWQNELARWGEYPTLSRRENMTSTLDRVLTQLDLSRLAQLQFLGGEPFLSDHDNFIIDRIPNPQQCRLKYTTNGSVWPQSYRWHQWSKFKEVVVNFSIDGIEKRFEYLRYPLSWNIVQDNILRFIDKAPSNMKFHVNHTLTPFNVFYYDEYLDWAKKVFPSDKFLGTHVHSAYGIMSLGYAPDKLRLHVREKYGVDHPVSGAIAHYHYNTNEEFWKYVELWDKRRNLSWKSVFEEVIDLLS